MRSLTIAFASLTAALVVGSTLTTASPVAATAAPAQTTIDEMSELFIIDVGVVDDPRAYDGGPWSFGGIMSGLAGNVPPDQFVEQWIRTLTTRTDVNGDPEFVGGRLDGKDLAFDEFFDDWRNRSPGPNVDLDSAPFRLLAIVNRPDLLRIENGVIQSAGEARFVFAAVDPTVADVRAAESDSRKFFVIFEYGIPASTCDELQSWHEQWHDLSMDPLGSAAYNANLQAITDQFTLPVPGSTAVNKSLLNQLRTNEFRVADDSLIWDLREWNLADVFGNPSLGLLRSVTTKQTPSQWHIRGGPVAQPFRQRLRAWLDANRSQILAGTHVVPEQFMGAVFLGGAALNDINEQRRPPAFAGGGGLQGGTAWWAQTYSGNANTMQLVSEETARVRHGFALQTCAGCHFAESGTDGIVADSVTGHVQSFSMTDVRSYLQPTTLSPFLTGTKPFPDPVNPDANPDAGGGGPAIKVVHQFDDLERRVEVMRRILELDCGADGISVAEDIAAETGTRVH